METSLFLTQSAFPAVRRDARALFSVAARRPRVSAMPLVVSALEKGPGAPGNAAKKSGAGGVPNSNYVVPLDLAPSFCRPLKEILRDLNKRVPDNIINRDDNSIPWYLSTLFPFPFDSLSVGSISFGGFSNFRRNLVQILLRFSRCERPSLTLTFGTCVFVKSTITGFFSANFFDTIGSAKCAYLHCQI